MIPALTTGEALSLLGALIAVSGGVAGVVQVAKMMLSDVLPDLPQTRRRWILRALGVGLGALAFLPLGADYGAPPSVSLAVGALAGAASEVVYRWLIDDLMPWAWGRLRDAGDDR